jgi:hypothetical protein
MRQLVFELQTNSLVPCPKVRSGTVLCEKGNLSEQELFVSDCAIEVISVFG